MPEWMMINSIEPSNFDEGTCYIAGTRYKLGDFTPYLYKTTDYGKTWVNITSGIDPEHFTRVLREDPFQKGLLYAGTETGMYVSFNDGASWQKFQLNLPVVPITDLVIKENNLIVATQGRSLWILDDLTLLHQLPKAKAAGGDFLFAPKASYRTRGGGGKKSNILLVEAAYAITIGLDAIVRWDWLDPDINISSDEVQHIIIGFEWFPYSFVELRPQYRFMIEDPSVTNDSFVLQFHFWY